MMRALRKTVALIRRMSATVFRNARIIDGTGDAPFSADVRVVGNRIAAIERNPRPSAGDAADVVDCAGATLMPGLIEPHAHLSFVDQATPQALSAIPVEEHVLLTLKHAKLYLDQGFTSCFSAAATKPRLDIVARNAIDRGEHPGPRLKAASVQFTVTGGVGDLRQMHLDPGEAMYTLPCDGPVEFRRAAREACREGVDVLKIVPSGDTSTPAVPSARTLMTDDEVAAVCDVARAQERVVAAHARSAESIRMCVRNGVTVIYHATCADDDALDLLEAHKATVFVAPALSVTVTRLRDAGKFGLPSSDAMRARIDADLERTIATMKGAEGTRGARAARRRLRLHVESARRQRARPAVFRRSARLHTDGSDRRRDEMGRRDHGQARRSRPGARRLPCRPAARRR